MMNPQDEIFESGNATALICVNDENIYSIIDGQLRVLGYESQSGLFREDVALRLQTHTYNVLVVEEGFEKVEGERNPVIMDCRDLSPAHRRFVFIVLVGPDFRSENCMQAFQHSVDLVVATKDLGSLAAILRRNLEDHQSCYQPFLECAEQARVM